MQRAWFALVALGAVVIAAPAVAPAALVLQFDGGNGPLSGGVPVPGPGPYFIDVALVETGTPKDEQLFAYDLHLRANSNGPVRLAGAEKPDNWVFTDPAANFLVASSSPTEVMINAVNRLTPPFSDITSGAKVARVLYTFDCVPGASTLFFDPNNTIFASGDPNQDPFIPVDTTGPLTYFSLCPEPTGLALLPLAAALALRRRRM